MPVVFFPQDCIWLVACSFGAMFRCPLHRGLPDHPLHNSLGLPLTPPFTFWLFSLWWCVFFLPDTYYCLIYCYVVTSFLSVSLLFEGKDFVLSTAPSPKMGINRHIVGNGYISAEWMYEWMDTARNQVRRNYIRLITARWNELPWLMFLLCRW